MKKLAQLQLLQAYNNDPNFALNARMIIALAFVPIANLDAYLAQLAQHVIPPLIPVLAWFEEYYIGLLNS